MEKPARDVGSDFGGSVYLRGGDSAGEGDASDTALADRISDRRKEREGERGPTAWLCRIISRAVSDILYDEQHKKYILHGGIGTDSE